MDEDDLRDERWNLSYYEVQISYSEPFKAERFEDSEEKTRSRIFDVRIPSLAPMKI